MAEAGGRHETRISRHVHSGLALVKRDLCKLDVQTRVDLPGRRVDHTAADGDRVVPTHLERCRGAVQL